MKLLITSAIKEETPSLLDPLSQAANILQTQSGSSVLAFKAYELFKRVTVEHSAHASTANMSAEFEKYVAFIKNGETNGWIGPLLSK